MVDTTIDQDDKKHREEKKRKRLKNYKEWLTEFQSFFNASKISKVNSLTKIHANLPNVKKLNFIPYAAEILNHKYWEIVNDYLRLSISLPGKVGESKLINRYKVISATELTIMSIRPIEYSEESEDLKNEETEKFLNALFAWYVAIVLIESWEEEDNKSQVKRRVQYGKNIIKTSTLFEPALKDEPEAINFRDEHIRWLAYVETDSYIPVLSNAQTWRMFYFCLQALDNGLKDFTKRASTNKKHKANENRGNTITPNVRSTSRPVSRK